MTAQTNSRKSTTAPLRVWLVAALPLAEILFIALVYDALVLTEADGTIWFRWLAYSGYVLKTLLAMIAALLLGIGPRLVSHWQDLGRQPARPLMLTLHVLAFVALWGATDAIFSPSAVAAPPSGWIPLIWVLLVPLTLLSWAAALASWRFWQSLARQERSSFLLALAMGPFALAVAMSAQALWLPFSELTLEVSAWMLSLVRAEVLVDYEQVLLGSGDFIVLIDQACSGYEGVGLVSFFTAFYLSLFRKDFRFPNALVLFPIGIVVIWFFNAVRIVALIVIGDEISPEIALGGFHSQAGWIMFICVAIAILISADRIRWFSRKPGERAPTQAHPEANLAAALLVPLIVLLASTLLTSAFSAGHDWLYPLRVLATALAIIWAWRRLGPISRAPTLSIWPPLAGGCVFVIWLLMVPTDAARSEVTATALAASPAWLALAWLILRTLGSAVTVPIAEELAFRGYLLHRLAGIPLTSRLTFSWLSFVGSSVLFGLLHSAWAAGMLAGFVYALVRYQRDNVSDAIVAHATTNLLLSIYVMTTGAWSLW